MRKLEALKVVGFQREEKGKKMHFVSWEVYFLFFSLLLFICTSKMISRASGVLP
jgi:hypothetical protein